MSTIITLNVYSGRTNPTWMLTTPQERELHERISSSTLYSQQRPSGVLGGLGFRGLTITRDAQSSAGPLVALLHEGIFDRGLGQPNLVDATGAGEWLLGTSGRAVDDDLKAFASTQVAQSPLVAANAQAPGPCPAVKAADAPAYSPGSWNIPTVQPYNNCYNYANDHATNTFAQPGRASGHPFAATACADVGASAQADGLQTSPNFSNQLGAGAGWYVALVVWPKRDYHWYRQDRSGCWSHKPGQTVARDVDNAGKQITDPQHCDRGPYSDFCGYRIAKRSNTIS